MTKTEAQALGENDYCPLCKNTGLMICPAELHMKETDPKYGTCWTCDGVDVPERTGCLCQDD